MLRREIEYEKKKAEWKWLCTRLVGWQKLKMKIFAQEKVEVKYLNSLRPCAVTIFTA